MTDTQDSPPTSPTHDDLHADTLARPALRGAEIDVDGTPVSRATGDVYYSRTDGRAETEEVFLTGNGLPERWASLSPGATFTVGELGFGTGLTCGCLAKLWSQARKPHGVQLSIVSFEWDWLPRETVLAALAPWPDLIDALAPLLDDWPAPDGATPRIACQLREDLQIAVHVGDARERVPDWEGRADAWCLDGFSPACNPELWEPRLLAAVARATAPGGTVSTYSAAGHVRRSLIAAGFDVQKVPGFGRKRERLAGYMPPCP